MGKKTKSARGGSVSLGDFLQEPSAPACAAAADDKCDKKAAKWGLQPRPASAWAAAPASPAGAPPSVDIATIPSNPPPIAAAANNSGGLLAEIRQLKDAAAAASRELAAAVARREVAVTEAARLRERIDTQDRELNQLRSENETAHQARILAQTNLRNVEAAAKRESAQLKELHTEQLARLHRAPGRAMAAPTDMATVVDHLATERDELLQQVQRPSEAQAAENTLRRTAPPLQATSPRSEGATDLDRYLELTALVDSLRARLKDSEAQVKQHRTAAESSKPLADEVDKLRGLVRSHEAAIFELREDLARARADAAKAMAAAASSQQRAGAAEADAARLFEQSRVSELREKQRAIARSGAEQTREHMALSLLLRATTATLKLRRTDVKYDTVMPNPCLFTALNDGAVVDGDSNAPSRPPCRALLRFQAGLLLALGMECVSRLAEGSAVSAFSGLDATSGISIGFHGTRSAEAILCHGFDTSKRNGQRYGPGEYFAYDWPTAQRYAECPSGSAGAAGTPAVLVVLILSERARPVNDGNWLVVDNPSSDDGGASYCLPLAAIPLHANAALRPCPQCSPAARLPSSAPAETGRASSVVEFQDNRGRWEPMQPAASATVLAAHAAGTTRNVLTVGTFSYDFDWQRMVQINTGTGRERSIRFA